MMNLATIKIFSLLIGFTAIGACLKLAFEERLVMRQIKNNRVIELMHIKKSDSIIKQNINNGVNKIAGKNFLLEQNIILYY